MMPKGVHTPRSHCRHSNYTCGLTRWQINGSPLKQQLHELIQGKGEGSEGNFTGIFHSGKKEVKTKPHTILDDFSEYELLLLACDNKRLDPKMISMPWVSQHVAPPPGSAQPLLKSL